MFNINETTYMTRSFIITAAAVAALAVSTPVLAQSTASDAGATVAVKLGGFSPVVDLNDAKTADFKTGVTAGAGLGYQFNPYIGVRATFDYARTESRGAGQSTALIAGTKVNRYIYGAEIKLNAPTGSVSPYLLAGAGAVTFSPDVTNHTNFTKPAGKVGVGLDFTIPNTRAAIFVEGAGWFYKFDQNGFDKAQFDIAYTAGVSYRFGAK